MWQYVHQCGSRTAYEDIESGRKYNFEELYELSHGFGAGLLKSGIQRGDVIGLLLPNIPEYPIVLLGSLETGAIVSPINPDYTFLEISDQLASSGTKCVITMERFLPAILEARSSCSQLNKIIVIGHTVPQGCLSYCDLVKTDSRGYSFLNGNEIDMKTIALLSYSSGTTGSPKGVELTHFNLTTNIVQSLAPNVSVGKFLFVAGEQERYLGILPFHHSMGYHFYHFYGVCLGAHTLCVPSFNPESFVGAIRQHKPTTLQLVPPLVSLLCGCDDVGRKELESVHTIVVGGAVTGQSLINKLLEKAGRPIFFQEIWGMTELDALSLSLSPKFGRTKGCSSGVTIPNTIGKIIDISTGESLPTNQKGELCVKGPQMTKGYLNNPKQTAETIDPQGWLHSGNIGYYDTDSCFYIVDRLRELINVKGIQVASSELEDLLRMHEGVEDVAVIGVPDPRVGQVPRAYIVKKKKGLRENEIHQFLNGRVIDYKQLKGGIEFVDTKPISSAGEILRRILLEDYKERHDLLML